MKFPIITLFIIPLLFTCSGKKKEHETRANSPATILSCATPPLTNRKDLSESEVNRYANQLPEAIHENVEDKLKKNDVIDAAKIIRGCLDINLVSTREIINKIQIRLKQN